MTTYIISEEPSVSVPSSFLIDLYTKGNSTIKQLLEKAFPFVKRPTYKVGDRLKFFRTSVLPINHSTIDLLIVGPAVHLVGTKVTGCDTLEHTPPRIALVDLSNGAIYQETVEVKDITKITEEEILQAGKALGLTPTNFSKFETRSNSITV